MLIEFSVENYLSFRERRVLSMEATGISDHPENTFEVHEGRYKLLKGAAIYGANSSGKSNLISAFDIVKKLITRRFGLRRVLPHLLYQPSANLPTKFEVLFILDKVRYRYGFAVQGRIVKSEWLYQAEKNAEKMLFIRQEQVIEVSEHFSEGNSLEDKTREDRLFINVVSDFNGQISRSIVTWFAKSQVLLGLDHKRYAQTTINIIQNEDNREGILKFYNELNLGFSNMIIEEDIQTYTEEDGSEHTEKQEIPKTIHIRFNEKFEPSSDTVLFDLKAQESDGTNKLFNLSGKLFETLAAGGLLIVDELDSSLHPLIMLTIVRLFNSEKTNPRNAQLIYTTHDTNMLHYGNYRRDQIWFTEKDKYGGTDLYALAEIKDKPRKEANYEEQYIKGRYGAIPYIGNVEKLFEEWHRQEK